MPPPNLIVIMADSLRYDRLGANGNNWIQTPNLDAFAARAVIFDRSYQGSFPTIPTRTDMFTGRYVFPFRGWSSIPPDHKVLPEYLAEAGYHSMLVADTYHLFRDGANFDRGFDAFAWIRGQENDRFNRDDIEVTFPCAPEKAKGYWVLENYLKNVSFRRTEDDWFVAQTATRATEWLDRNHAREPFLLWVDSFDPHEPWDPPAWSTELYDPGYQGEELIFPPYREVGFCSPAELNHIGALYCGEVTLVDKWLGLVLQRIEELGLFANSYVIFMSDHGHLHGEHGRVGKSNLDTAADGWQFYQEINHQALMVRGPGIEGGVRNQTLVQSVDLFATLLDLAGRPLPEGLHGQSLVPALQGETLRGHTVAVTSAVLPDRPRPLRYSSTTDGEWSLEYTGGEGPAELYDLGADPRQEHDVLRAHPEKARELHARTLEKLRALGAPPSRLALREGDPTPRELA
jgi:arylsulfatase A-like enzyme